MAPRATGLFPAVMRFSATRSSRNVFKRANSNSATPRLPSSSSWSPLRAGILALALSGVGFAAGIVYTKSSGQDINYSRALKFSAPKYGTTKDMQTVRFTWSACKLVWLSKVKRLSRRFVQPSEKIVSVQMMRISSYTATQSCHRQTLTLFPLRLSTPKLRKKCLTS